jgi:hypothetical protein
VFGSFKASKQREKFPTHGEKLNFDVEEPAVLDH